MAHSTGNLWKRAEELWVFQSGISVWTMLKENRNKAPFSGRTTFGENQHNVTYEVMLRDASKNNRVTSSQSKLLEISNNKVPIAP